MNSTLVLTSTSMVHTQNLCYKACSKTLTRTLHQIGVPVAKELQYLKNYLMLEKMRYKNNTEIVCNIVDSQINNQMIAPLLTFIFVENAFKYGLKSKNKGFLKINISIVGKIFYFSIIMIKMKKTLSRNLVVSNRQTSERDYNFYTPISMN